MQGDFYQPTDNQLGRASNAEESSWIGLGAGYGYQNSNGGLIQAGTAINESIQAPDGTYPLYASFVELLNNTKNSNFGPDYLGKFTVNPGDHIHIHVSYNQSDTTADFYIANDTTGQYGILNWDIALGILAYGPYYDGSTAEWIDEQPNWSSNGPTVPLADLGGNSWFNAQKVQNVS